MNNKDCPFQVINSVDEPSQQVAQDGFRTWVPNGPQCWVHLGGGLDNNLAYFILIIFGLPHIQSTHHRDCFHEKNYSFYCLEDPCCLKVRGFP